MAALLKRLAGETAVYGLSSILGRLLHFVILTPYLTRTLSRVEYGIYTDLYVWAALLLVVLTYRMETTFFRFGRQSEDRAQAFSTALWFLGLAVLVFVSAGLIFAQPIANWLAYPQYPQYVVWFTFIIGFDALAALPFAQLRLEGRPVRFAAIRIVGMLVNIALIFVFLEVLPRLEASSLFRMGGGDWATLDYLFLANLLASGITLLLLLPAFRTFLPVLDGAYLKRMLRYASLLVLAGIAGVTNQMIGAPMLKWLASDDILYNLAQAGIYGAAAKLAVFMNLFTQAFNYAAEPFFFKLAGKSDDRKVYAQVAQAFTLSGSLAFLVILLYLEVIQFFLGEAFREELNIVPVLLLANLLLGLFYNFSIWYKLEDKTHIGGWIALGGTAIVLAVNVFFIPQAGYHAPAWATLACYGFMVFAAWFTGRKAFPIPFRLGRMAFYAGSAVALFLLSEYVAAILPDVRMLRLAVNTGLLILYLLAVAWVERDSLKQVIRSGMRTTPRPK